MAQKAPVGFEGSRARGLEGFFCSAEVRNTQDKDSGRPMSGKRAVRRDERLGPVPEEAASWNCRQDYGSGMLLEVGAIDDATWSFGDNLMFSLDGQGSGGQEGHQFDEYEGDEDEGEADHDGGRRVLSEEFVCHSDDAGQESGKILSIFDRTSPHILVGHFLPQNE
ncbi:hypothetical protein E4U13_006004 [Claviceps humidiphila]|uniref:Uncharacterized protein n=1 Tax=Claviceps humidiphila TaxID=1294629 RepID=A0A9P7PZP6_9HYPO|nr:hypothetical protein E4U13_006004 [Claviceps humidiphila]